MTKPRPTIRECEHFGDRVANLAVSELVFNLFPNSERYYFDWTGKLISNKNFATYYKEYKSKNYLDLAKRFEIEIGKIYFNNGINFALKNAKFRIKQTKQWIKMMRLNELE